MIAATLPHSRLSFWLALSVGLHLLFWFLWQWALPPEPPKPKIFEVQWIDPSSTRAQAAQTPAPKQAPPTPEPPAPAQKQAPAAPKPAPKPKLDLTPAPLGLSGGGLSLGRGELNPQGPSDRSLGAPQGPSAKRGLAAQADPGSPEGIRAGTRGQGSSTQAGAAPLRSKLQVRERPDQGGTAPQTGSPEGTGRIEGQVKGRPLLYRPPAPNLNIERDVTITLRFTVLPDGSVESIVPVVKGEPRLEALAIDLLGRYRFEPISGNQPQEGVIHFRLERNAR